MKFATEVVTAARPTCSKQQADQNVYIVDSAIKGNNSPTFRMMVDTRLLVVTRSVNKKGTVVTQSLDNLGN